MSAVYVVFNKLVVGIAVIIIASAAASKLEAESRRVALLIGNAAHDVTEFNLANPVNDIEALGKALIGIGFHVRQLPNANVGEMRDGLNWLIDTSQDAEISLVFFAGHGVQINDRNFLIGTGIQGLTANAVSRSSLSLAEIQAALEKTNAALGIVFLDACRNNPLSESEELETGLARTPGSAGQLIAYATDPGNVAYDGAGQNSLFTEALLRHVSAPGLDVRLMLGRVRQSVIAKTRGRQIPWVEEAVIGQYALNPADGRTSSQLTEIDGEIALWQDVALADVPSEYERYLSTYPEGTFTVLAEARLNALKSESVVASPLDLDSVNPETVRVSLAMLGYLPATRGFDFVDLPTTDEATRTELDMGFNAWVADQPFPAEATVLDLVEEGARSTLFFGANTGLMLRQTIKELNAQRGALRAAANDLDYAVTYVAENYGEDNPEANTILDEMAQHVAEIEELISQKERYLDNIRNHYAELIKTSEAHFAGRIRPEMLRRGGNELTRQTLPNNLELRVNEQILIESERFVQYVNKASNAPRGSWAWLADFLNEEA